MGHGEADDVEEASDGLFSVAGFNVLDELAGIKTDKSKPHIIISIPDRKMPSEKTLAQYAQVVSSLERRGIDFGKHKEAMAIIMTKDRDKGEASPNTVISVLTAVKATLIARGNTADLEFYTAEHSRRMKERMATQTFIKDPEKFEEWSKVLADFAERPTLTRAVYTLFAPRRLEWRLVKVVGDMSEVKDDDGMNYYAKKDRALVFQEYKTKGKYGKQVFTLRRGSPLERILNERREGLLFPADGEGKLYDAKAFSKKVKRDTGMSVNDFRHSYITHFLTLSPSVSEKIETATMMAHSIGTQALYQRDDEASDSE